MKGLISKYFQGDKKARRVENPTRLDHATIGKLQL